MVKDPTKPSDKVLLADTIKHHKIIFGKGPAEVAKDRGYYFSSNEIELT